MKKFLLPYILVVLLIIILYPKQSLGFTYQGPLLGVNFNGNELFDNAALSPGQATCKTINFSNSSSSEQTLGFVGVNLNTGGLFDVVNIIFRDSGNVYFQKQASLVSSDANNAENIIAIPANSQKNLNLCIAMFSNAGDNWQNKTSNPFGIRFGFIGQAFTPTIGGVGPTTTTDLGLTTNETVGGATTGPLTVNNPSSNQNGNNQGTVAGVSTGGRNWTWLWWLIILIIVLTGGYIWYRRRNVSQQI